VVDPMTFTIRSATFTADKCPVWSLKTCYTLYFVQKHDPSQHTLRTTLRNGMCMSTCEYLNKDCKAQCCDVRQLLSMYSLNRKHVQAKNVLYALHFYESNITHDCHVKQGGATLKIHRNVIKYTTKNNFWIYYKVLRLSGHNGTL